MYAKHKKIISCIFVFLFAGLLVLLLTSLEHKKNVEIIKIIAPNIITFVSISFGFYLTNLSVLFSSSYIKTLIKEDKKEPTQREIHTIREYFKWAIFCALLTIVLSLMTLMASGFENEIILKILFALLLSVVVINFIFVYLLLKIFMNALVNEAMSKK